MSRLRLLPVFAGLVLMAGPVRSAEPILYRFDVAANSVYSLAFSPDGKLLAAQAGAQIHIWDTQTGKEVRRIAEEPSPGVWSVAFSPDGKTVYAPLQDQSVATGKLVRLFRGHTSTVWSATVSPDGKVLASGGEDTTVRLWDTSTGQERFQLKHPSGVWPFLFSPSGKELVSIGSGGTLSIWDVATGRELKQYPTETGIWPLALTADGRLAAVVSWQRPTVRLVDLNTGQVVRSIEIQPGTGWNLAFSPDSRVLAASGPDNTVGLWEVATGQPRRRLAGHKAKVDTVAWSPAGGLVASASADGKVILWDVTGER
jgi:uncharacterized protein with WD repeat